VAVYTVFKMHNYVIIGLNYVITRFNVFHVLFTCRNTCQYARRTVRHVTSPSIRHLLNFQRNVSLFSVKSQSPKKETMFR